MNNKEQSAPKGAGQGFFRLLSFLAATAVMILIVIYPRAIAPDSESVPHGWLDLMLFGMSLCWLYGFGFTPKRRIFRILLHPILGWICLGIGVWKVFI